MYLLMSLLQLQLHIPVQLIQYYNETKCSITIDTIRKKRKQLPRVDLQHNITVKTVYCMVHAYKLIIRQ